MSVFSSVNSQNNAFDDFANAVRRAKELAAKINGEDTIGTKRPLDDVAAIGIPEAKKLAVSDDKGIVQQLATMQAQRSAGGIADAITVEEWKVPDKMVGLKMAPEIAKPAPDFAGIAVINGAFKNIKLSDYKGKYLVLFFYPLDFTFVCPTEIIAFSERVEEFKKIGCEVIGCSTDSHFSHLAWINIPRKEGGLGKMNIPLLADKSCKISKDYGVYKEDEGLTFRGLFIIDDNGTLRQITINDLPVGRSVDETLRLVQAIQYTDKYGEVCPAGWKPGNDTMKPDPDGSKEYFKKH